MTPPGRSGRAAPTEHEEALSFIAGAIARAATVRRRDGLPVPAIAILVARWCADAARSGEDRQPLGIADIGVDVGVMDQLLLTDKDAATLLRVSARTVRAMIADGRLPAIKVGGATRIRRSDLDVFIAGQPATARFREHIDVKASDVVGGAA